MTFNVDRQELDRLREMLPAYVNGTATPNQRKELEAALAESLELRHELWEVEAMHTEFTANEQLSHAHAEQLLARIKSNIRSMPEQRSIVVKSFEAADSTSESWWSRLSNRSRLGWGFALAQFVVIVVFVGATYKPSTVSYETLSASSNFPVSGTRINLVISESAPQAEVNSLMRDNGLRYVDGPLANGLVVVFLPDNTQSVADVLERIKKSPIVQFAEPVIGQ